MPRSRAYVTNVAVIWKLEDSKTEPWEQKHNVSKQTVEHNTVVLWRGGSPHSPWWSWMAPPCSWSSRLCNTVSKIKESCSLHGSESQDRGIVPSTWNGQTVVHYEWSRYTHSYIYTQTQMHTYIPRHACIYFSDYKVDAQRQTPGTQKQFGVLFYILMWSGSATINLSQEDQLKVKGNSCSR